MNVFENAGTVGELGVGCELEFSLDGLAEGDELLLLVVLELLLVVHDIIRIGNCRI